MPNAPRGARSWWSPTWRAATQRLVKAADMAKDPLRDVLEKRLRMAKSGMEETAQGRVFLTVYVPSPQARHHRRGAYQPDAGAARRHARLRRDHRRSAHGLRLAGALSRRQADRGMAGRRAAAAQCRPLYGFRRAHPRSEDRRPGAQHALSRDCFYIGALGSKKTHAKRVDAAEGGGAFSDAAIARIHAPIGLPIGAVSPAEIALAIMAEITQTLRLKAEKERRRHEIRRRPRRGGARRHRGAFDPPGRSRAQEGHADRREGSARAGARRRQGDRGGARRARRRSEDRAAADIAAAVAGAGIRIDRAFTGRCNLFAEGAGVLVVDKDADRPPQHDRRGGDAGDAFRLQAGGGRRDDRHRQDHSLRGRRRARATPRWPRRRRRSR